MVEESRELAQAIMKGKSREEIIEENIDLLNLIIGKFINIGVSLEEVKEAFWKKHKKIMDREKIKTDSGNYRVSEFK